MSARTNVRTRARWGILAAGAVAAVTVGLAVPAEAGAGDTYTISGHVVDERGAPLSPYILTTTPASGPATTSYGYSNALSTTANGEQTVTLDIQVFSMIGFGSRYVPRHVVVPVQSSDVDLGDIVVLDNVDCTTKTKLTGTLRVGGTLTAAPGTLTPAGVAPTATYTWSRVALDGSGIDGELYTTPLDVTGSSYTLTAADEGAQIVVTASVDTPTRGSDSCAPLTTRSVAAALPTAPVALAPVPGTTTPAVSGPAKVGKKVTAQAAAPGAAATYQWLRNGKPVAGATSPTFKITKASKGKRISVVVTYTRDGYAPVVVTSPTTKIKK